MTMISQEKIQAPSDTKGSASTFSKVGSLKQHTFEQLDSKDVTHATYEFLSNIETKEAKEEGTINALPLTEETLCDQEKALEEMKGLLKTERYPQPIVEQEEKEKSTFHSLHECQKERVLEKKETEFFSFKKEKESNFVEKKERVFAVPTEGELLAQRAELSKKMQEPQLQKAPFFSIPAKNVKKEKSESKKEQLRSHHYSFAASETTSTPIPAKYNPKARDKEQGQQQKEKEQQEQRQQEEEKEEVEKVDKKKGVTQIDSSAQAEGGGDIFFRFMALMARILGQAQAEANTLYQRIKERTDHVDILTSLLGKINNQPKKIDWSKDEEMKALVDKARVLGVDIPEGKYSWSEDEKRLLKENIQMRKDTLEKMSQLERTDMQRFMQETSQCHQARSNVLKLLKEIIDTFIANLRGH